VPMNSANSRSNEATSSGRRHAVVAEEILAPMTRVSAASSSRRPPFPPEHRRLRPGSGPGPHPGESQVTLSASRLVIPAAHSGHEIVCDQLGSRSSRVSGSAPLSRTISSDRPQLRTAAWGRTRPAAPTTRARRNHFAQATNSSSRSSARASSDRHQHQSDHDHADHDQNRPAFVTGASSRSGIMKLPRGLPEPSSTLGEGRLTGIDSANPSRPRARRSGPSGHREHWRKMEESRPTRPRMYSVRSPVPSRAGFY